MSTQKLGRYDLTRVIGKGAMGVVYEGRDPNLDRRVAIKTILVDNLTAEAVADYEVRFKTEAKSAARLQHPNIVSVYDSDRDGNVAFLVMEFIQGEDLKHHLDRGVRFQLDQSVAIVRDLLSALDYAHRQNVIHRDVKPANLLLEPSGRVKLTDFGVARIQDSNEATRTQGSIVGTLKYMAPEQVQGHSVDARTDLFAAGVVLYQLLTGRRPFDDDNDFAIMHQIIGKTPEAPSNINPLLPKTLDAVVVKALSKARDERFATARDFALALQSACRRATDTTVVPPISASTASGMSQPGMPSQRGGTDVNALTGGTSASTVTQEVELVYWKDVKDTADLDDLRGFLVRFPTGIYADLARRRIRKLSGLATDGTLSGTQSYAPDSTQTELALGAVHLGDGASLPGAHDSTRQISKASEAGVTEADFDPLATVKMMSDDQDATMHMPIPALAGQAMASTPVTEAISTLPDREPTLPTVKLEPKTEAPTGVVAALYTSADPIRQTKKSSFTLAAISLTGLLVIGFAAKLLWPTANSNDKSVTVETSSVPEKKTASPTALPKASFASNPLTVASTPLQTASRPTLKTIAADKARAAEIALKASKPTSGVDTKPSSTANPSVPSTEMKQPDAPTKAIAAPVPVQAPILTPKAACEGKILLAYHSCMMEQCVRPAYQNDPACIERFEIEQRARNRQF